MTPNPSQVKELIERLRNGCYCHELKVSPAQKCAPCEAAAAILDLRADRDALRALVLDMRWLHGPLLALFAKGEYCRKAR